MNGKYELIWNYRDNKHYNTSLSNLIRQNVNVFESWLFKARLDENYVPLSLIDERGNVVASIGALKAQVYLEGVRYDAVQLGHFFVKNNHRHEGLDHFLLEQFVNKYSNMVDLLFAFNSDYSGEMLLNTGFREMPEYTCFVPWEGHRSTGARGTIRRLDLDNGKDMQLLQTMIRHSAKNSSALSTNGDYTIKMYNILKHFRKNVYHVLSLDCLIVFNLEAGTFNLIDVFAKNSVDIDELLELLVPSGIKVVTFGFVPKIDNLHYQAVTTGVGSEPVMRNRLYFKPITVSVDDKKLLMPLLSLGK